MGLDLVCMQVEGGCMGTGPQRTGVDIVGGTSTTPRVIAPPWETEEALLVLVAVTAYGNAATNLIYVATDVQEILQGNQDLLQADHGLVFAINGVGSLPIPHIPIRVTEKVTVQPAPAANGQIYLMYYWERTFAPLIPAGGFDLPSQMDREPVEVTRARVEHTLWVSQKPLNPQDLLRQEQEQVTPRMRKRMRTEDFLGDLKGQRKN